MFCPKSKFENYDLGLVEDARKGLDRSRDSVATSLSPGRSSFVIWAYDSKREESVEVLIDEDDYKRLSPYYWIINSAGYVLGRGTNPRGKIGSISRIIMGVSKGDRCIIDHKNHDLLDNRKSNLRITDWRGNGQNCYKWKKPTISKYKGVKKVRRLKSESGFGWDAEITINGRRTHVGSFKTELAAARAYDEAAKKYFKEFACLNFPERGLTFGG